MPDQTPSPQSQSQDELKEQWQSEISRLVQLAPPYLLPVIRKAVVDVMREDLSEQTGE